jgi:hypothetical protein
VARRSGGGFIFLVRGVVLTQGPTTIPVHYNAGKKYLSGTIGPFAYVNWTVTAMEGRRRGPPCDIPPSLRGN